MNKAQQNLLLEEYLLTPEKFNEAIEKNRINFDTYLETISDYCTENNIELKLVKKILNSQIISKLSAECEELNLICRDSSTISLFK